MPPFGILFFLAVNDLCLAFVNFLFALRHATDHLAFDVQGLLLTFAMDHDVVTIMLEAYIWKSVFPSTYRM
jgi:hypothetical protein